MKLTPAQVALAVVILFVLLMIIGRALGTMR